MIRAKVINCNELSIRREVTIPEEYTETIAVLKEGDTILVDVSKVYWSWTDERYYMTSLGGYANIKCLELINSK